ncbi:hypothetical protein L1077_13980 [Pseudoalteromonas luteoviolacea]|uniref:hypothetical protein n=1 Tax=Pseudoalteromonas luteoviolacea TaxID=43657 RepID=UPI001F302DD0|nr:hypothetical protein [Pseudoalteromonas luteoviolacea]MCF6440542.1 hypothetical protein [Pseudoalteromonas luteoviolacea]
MRKVKAAPYLIFSINIIIVFVATFWHQIFSANGGLSFILLVIFCVLSLSNCVYHMSVLLVYKVFKIERFKVLALMMPALLLLAYSIFSSALNMEENRRSLNTSSSEQFIARVSASFNYWHIEVENALGQTVYKNENTAMRSAFSLYWVWDKQDRLWFYYSDDGTVHYLSKSNDGWQLREYDKFDDALELKPPSSLFPPYVIPKQKK